MHVYAFTYTLNVKNCTQYIVGYILHRVLDVQKDNVSKNQNIIIARTELTTICVYATMHSRLNAQLFRSAKIYGTLA